MKKIILVYGLLSGIVIIGSIIIGLVLTTREGAPAFSQVLGYLIMIVALSFIFVGVKRYRDQELGGVIRFGTALLLGLGISVVASVIYVAVWEFYLSLTDHAFIEQYTQSIIAEKKAAGVTGLELEQAMSEMEELQVQYANPLFRLPMTFLEIFPVGLLISLISAAILRNRKILPQSE